MPKRTDVRKILIIGSGPIQIGQAAEFDFSGSQACKAVREEGYKVVLVNSNPATIMTDAGMADAVYVEPLTLAALTAIIEKERPDGVLAGMGGQTALNLVSELAEAGVLAKFGVKLLGTPLQAIADAEDRDLFKKVMERIGEPVAKADVASSVADALRIQKEFIGRYPVLVRPAYTLGGLGGGVAHSDEELSELVQKGLAYSRIHQVLIEESLLGWLEFEYEVMRDGRDNCIIICNMENLDPMGVHTGESIVVAPSQTLSDHDHQTLRTASLKIIRSLRIEGGCNVQFALKKETGEYRVIEVNPRVSRSSALASKATGYPIARVAAKVALGMSLDEIPNAITGKTVASFEPTLDYVVTKIPRWPFDKFRTVDPRIGTQMKSTGEVMAIGRNIEESLLKAVRSLEIDADSLEAPTQWDDVKLEEAVRVATHQRLFAVAEALRRGWTVAKVHDLSGYDPFFLHKILNVVALETQLSAKPGDAALLAKAKQAGFSDSHISRLWKWDEGDEWGNKVGAERRKHGILPDYKMVDTCAAEFEAKTPYYYSTYESRPATSPHERPATDFTDSTETTRKSVQSVQSVQSVARPGATSGATMASIPKSGKKKRVLVLGSGPIRIGQGIEFDYCCVHAAWAIREEGMESILLNNNPETVSTDFDTSDRLYFEPLTLEDVMHCIERERPDGVLVQFGGQTAINLALPLEAALAARPDLPTKIWGTSPAAIDLAEDRDKFNQLMRKLGIPQPEAGIAYEAEEAVKTAARITYPVLVRPSYVLGGRAMQVVHNEAELRDYIRDAVRVSKKTPVLIDRFLARAIEIDVDAVCDGTDVLVGAIMEHVEEAGVHSGDSTTVIPAQNVAPDTMKTIAEYTKKIALALGTRGLINIQFAVQGRTVYVLEANPRSSRTVPYVAKATGIPMAKIAAKLTLGRTLKDLKVERPPIRHVAVKAPVFPFLKLPGVDAVLGPEMKSTGEVMGIAPDYATAYAKAMEAAGNVLPTEGTVFISVAKLDRARILGTAEQLAKMGFELTATKGTAADLAAAGLQVTTVYKVSEKQSPDAIDLIRQGKVHLIVNTPSPDMEGPQKRDGFQMRRVAVECQIPFLATVEAAHVAVQAIVAKRRLEGRFEVQSLQEYAGQAAAKPVVAAAGGREGWFWDE